MSNIRTDMAMELKENLGYVPEGVDAEEATKKGIRISRITVKDKWGEMSLKKPIGKYATLDMGRIASMLPLDRKEAAKITAEELIRVIGTVKGNILIVGLGNRMVTPDSLGPAACETVFVTRHIKKHIPEAIDRRAADVCAIAPGVLGVTGLESFEVVKGVIDEIHPQLVIAIDALAARSIARIGASVQISDSGISPGSGLGNRREGLNMQTIGVRVVAVGVPTVVYAGTIVSDILEEAMKEDDQELKRMLIERASGTEGSELVVSPKDIDVLIVHAARLIGDALNMALNPMISPQEIEDYMS